MGERSELVQNFGQVVPRNFSLSIIWYVYFLSFPENNSPGPSKKATKLKRLQFLLKANRIFHIGDLNHNINIFDI